MRAGGQVSRTQSLPFLGLISTLSGQVGGAHSALLPERLEFQSPHCLPGAVPTDSAEIPRRLQLTEIHHLCEVLKSEMGFTDTQDILAFCGSS